MKIHRVLISAFLIFSVVNFGYCYEKESDPTPDERLFTIAGVGAVVYGFVFPGTLSVHGPRAFTIPTTIVGGMAIYQLNKFADYDTKHNYIAPGTVLFALGQSAQLYNFFYMKKHNGHQLVAQDLGTFLSGAGGALILPAFIHVQLTYNEASIEATYKFQ